MNQPVRLLAPLACMALLWGLSSVPASAERHGGFALPPWLQNTLHIPAYAGLCATWLWALDSRRSILWPSVLAFTATAAYAVVDELHQAFVPGRTASVEDMLLDVLGAALLVAWVAAAARRRRMGTALLADERTVGLSPCRRNRRGTQSV